MFLVSGAELNFSKGGISTQRISILTNPNVKYGTLGPMSIIHKYYQN